MYTREKIMSLKVGDKVKMTPRGFKYYSNLFRAFDMFSVARVMKQEHFTSCICELFAIHGVGTVKRFNSYGDPFIRWEYSINGMHFHYSHYYDLKDVKKLNLLEKAKLFLQRIF
jgi:hypothetical protein